MQDRTQQLRDLFLELVPSDGSAIGNQKLLTKLQQRISDITEQDYVAIRDALVEEGYLGKGRGRGGSVYLAASGDDADTTSAQKDDTFELEAEKPKSTATSSAKRKTSGTRGKTKATKTDSAQVLSYRHQDTRVNNPEVGMVHADNDPDEEPTTWSYDPHIDPALQFDIGRADIESLIDNALASGDQATMREALAELKRMQAPYLNWSGKAERTGFDVDTVSLHVHERIDPATILSNVRKKLRNASNNHSAAHQGNLFEAPFERLPLRKALDFYKHEKNWSNRLIGGDSLLVMNSLIHKESMSGQFQMIYMDPPYGIKYSSNFQPFTNKRDVQDKDEDLTQEPEMIKAFRDTWKLGIHSYLTYLRDRLLLCRQLLSNKGSVFVQINDENLHYVRSILDDIFGPEQFVQTIIIKKKSVSVITEPVNDYILWYCVDKSEMKLNPLKKPKDPSSEKSRFSKVEHPNLSRSPIKDVDEQDLQREDIRLLNDDYPMVSQDPQDGRSGAFEIYGENKFPGSGRHWTLDPNKGMKRLLYARRLRPTKNTVRGVVYLNDFGMEPYNNIWDFHGERDQVYVVQTNKAIVQRCMLMTTDPGDLVFDPTCGSGTTALIAEQWGRRWITTDTSRVSVTLTKQRLMTAGFDYYCLRYPQEGLKGGFLYKTVSKITLQDIAHNEEIDEIYKRLQPNIDDALTNLNNSLRGEYLTYKVPEGGRQGYTLDFSSPDNDTIELPNGEVTKRNTLLEWEVPSTFPENWPEKLRVPFQELQQTRRAMQEQIDLSIRSRAQQEPLYDDPEVDAERLRVTGPFTVEAVPSPTVTNLDDISDGQTEPDETIARSGETSRQTLWRDELVKTGIRGKNGQNMRIAELEAIPGLKHLHASGNLAENEERVVVSFGPEHAALEQRQVEAALDEAEKLRPKPKYIIFCAFTFDPEAAKDIDETNWPGATLLKAQMTTDLLTEDLKKGRASEDSFWLMGQPDVEVRTRDDGRYEVEVHGFDYFDPQKGELISGGKKKIAMWTLDTDYDNRSLMAHQVFFPMAGEKDGWHRLKKTVRAELDEDLLKEFHGTVSLPFEPGDHQRVAVKIVDDRGIESLKIIPLDA